MDLFIIYILYVYVCLYMYMAASFVFTVLFVHICMYIAHGTKAKIIVN